MLPLTSSRGGALAGIGPGNGFVQLANSELHIFEDVQATGSVGSPHVVAVNDRGVVAGWFRDYDLDGRVGYVWSPDEGPTVFEAPNSESTKVTGMNEDGTIVGFYLDKDRAAGTYERGFQLTPNSSCELPAG